MKFARSVWIFKFNYYCNCTESFAQLYREILAAFPPFRRIDAYLLGFRGEYRLLLHKASFSVKCIVRRLIFGWSLKSRERVRESEEMTFVKIFGRNQFPRNSDQSRKNLNGAVEKNLRNCVQSCINSPAVPLSRCSTERERKRERETAAAGNLITGRKSLTRWKSITSAPSTLTRSLFFKQCNARG